MAARREWREREDKKIRDSAYALIELARKNRKIKEEAEAKLKEEQAKGKISDKAENQEINPELEEIYNLESDEEEAKPLKRENISGSPEYGYVKKIKLEPEEILEEAHSNLSLHLKGDQESSVKKNDNEKLQGIEISQEKGEVIETESEKNTEKSEASKSISETDDEYSSDDKYRKIDYESFFNGPNTKETIEAMRSQQAAKKLREQDSELNLLKSEIKPVVADFVLDVKKKNIDPLHIVMKEGTTEEEDVLSIFGKKDPIDYTRSENPLVYELESYKVKPTKQKHEKPKPLIVELVVTEKDNTNDSPVGSIANVQEDRNSFSGYEENLVPSVENSTEDPKWESRSEQHLMHQPKLSREGERDDKGDFTTISVDVMYHTTDQSEATIPVHNCPEKGKGEEHIFGQNKEINAAASERSIDTEVEMESDISKFSNGEKPKESIALKVEYDFIKETQQPAQNHNGENNLEILSLEEVSKPSNDMDGLDSDRAYEGDKCTHTENTVLPRDTGTADNRNVDTKCNTCEKSTAPKVEVNSNNENIINESHKTQQAAQNHSGKGNLEILSLEEVIKSYNVVGCDSDMTYGGYEYIQIENREVAQSTGTTNDHKFETESKSNISEFEAGNIPIAEESIISKAEVNSGNGNIKNDSCEIQQLEQNCTGKNLVLPSLQKDITKNEELEANTVYDEERYAQVKEADTNSKGDTTNSHVVELDRGIQIFHNQSPQTLSADKLGNEEKACIIEMDGVQVEHCPLTKINLTETNNSVRFDLNQAFIYNDTTSIGTADYGTDINYKFDDNTENELLVEYFDAEPMESYDSTEYKDCMEINIAEEDDEEIYFDSVEYISKGDDRNNTETDDSSKLDELERNINWTNANTTYETCPEISVERDTVSSDVHINLTDISVKTDKQCKILWQENVSKSNEANISQVEMSHDGHEIMYKMTEGKIALEIDNMEDQISPYFEISQHESMNEFDKVNGPQVTDLVSGDKALLEDVNLNNEIIKITQTEHSEIVQQENLNTIVKSNNLGVNDTEIVATLGTNLSQNVIENNEMALNENTNTVNNVVEDAYITPKISRTVDKITVNHDPALQKNMDKINSSSVLMDNDNITGVNNVMEDTHLNKKNVELIHTLDKTNNHCEIDLQGYMNTINNTVDFWVDAANAVIVTEDTSLSQKTKLFNKVEKIKDQCETSKPENLSKIDNPHDSQPNDTAIGVNNLLEGANLSQKTLDSIRMAGENYDLCKTAPREYTNKINNSQDLLGTVTEDTNSILNSSEVGHTAEEIVNQSETAPQENINPINNENNLQGSGTVTRINKVVGDNNLNESLTDIIYTEVEINDHWDAAEQENNATMNNSQMTDEGNENCKIMEDNGFNKKTSKIVYVGEKLKKPSQQNMTHLNTDAPTEGDKTLYDSALNQRKYEINYKDKELDINQPYIMQEKCDAVETESGKFVRSTINQSISLLCYTQENEMSETTVHEGNKRVNNSSILSIEATNVAPDNVDIIIQSCIENKNEGNNCTNDQPKQVQILSEADTINTYLKKPCAEKVSALHEEEIPLEDHKRGIEPASSFSVMQINNDNRHSEGNRDTDNSSKVETTPKGTGEMNVNVLDDECKITVCQLSAVNFQSKCNDKLENNTSKAGFSKWPLDDINNATQNSISRFSSMNNAKIDDEHWEDKLNRNENEGVNDESKPIAHEKLTKKKNQNSHNCSPELQIATEAKK
ncbi:hypothetical protein AAG570_002441 [Ranatra chinensis]|uniref:Uncharacterized protein n=1 Tax=Ranatra chinensis TaxID=642074 RepID=A0ABD0Y7J0_9HEMI